MTGHGAKFGRKKEEAIAALLTHRSVEEAARSIGVVCLTLLRWMKIPEFDEAYREARRTAFRQSVARMQQSSSAAVTTLLKLMVDTNIPSSVRARSADSILNHTLHAMEIEDIDARVTALERAAKQELESE